MDAERSAKGYRARAEQIRVEAEGMQNPETKQALLHIADSYEQLANRLFWVQAIN